MTYEKPIVEVIAFDSNQEFIMYSPATNSQNPEADGRARAISLMGWNDPNDQITVQKGYDGKWMAYCSFVGGVTGNVYCDVF